MRSRQKRALFQREFGAALLPRGFVYRENMFLRLHPGEVLLAVGLDLAPSGGGYVEYGALPFCNGISRPPFSGLARVAVRDGRRWEDILHVFSTRGNSGRPWRNKARNWSGNGGRTPVRAAWRLCAR